MSVTSSRLFHHVVPGLQAQKCVSTVNTSASTIVTGTTFSMVWPSIKTTSKGSPDIRASSNPADSSRTPVSLRSGEAEGTGCAVFNNGADRQYTRSKPSSNCSKVLNVKFTVRTNS